MSSQLGMPRGTAANRLRKLVLFDLLKRHHENFCYQCGDEIQSADELSIEHKKPWENIDVKLFWDLTNIAFSHLLCNVRMAKSPVTRPKHRRLAPEGTAWCRTCQKFYSVEKFSKRSGRWNGLRHDCKDCEKKYKDDFRKTVSTVLNQPRTLGQPQG